MAFSPRWYQTKLVNGVREEWSRGNKSVLCVSPPRSGKTPMAVWLSEPFLQNGQGVFINAHRKELVRQIAMEFALFGHEHNIVAADDIVREIISRQIKEFGRSYYNQNALLMVAGVQTVNARRNKILSFANRVALKITDESHHVLPGNQWGKALDLFPNAYMVGFTATPARTDRKSMAKTQGGMFDAMVKGVTARQLINEGHICDYRIIAPPSSIDRESIKIGSKGEFTKKGLTEAKNQSTITGDCVKSYKKYSMGKQAVVFAVDIAHAEDLASAYTAAGIAAQSVSSKTPSHVRNMIMSKFERGVFNVLVNVDLFGEGLNVKGIETVIMARPTQSFVLYVQQFFRALTKGKPGKVGTIIDHAGNVGYFGKFYGLPDSYNGWELEDENYGKKRKRIPDDDLVAITTCKKCFSPYEVIEPKCPYCGYKPEPESRALPEHVEGDLVELDMETLRELRGEVDKLDNYDYVPPSLQNTPAEGRLVRVRRENREAQAQLRYNITLWAGWWRDQGESDSKIHRRFFHRFEIDILSAQALKKKDANILNDKVDSSLKKIMTGQ